MYATENDIYDALGYDAEFLQTFTKKTQSELSDLILKKITEAEKTVKQKFKIPFFVLSEMHISKDSQTSIELGPQDENHGIDFDPLNCVEKVVNLYFNGRKIITPYPYNCELGTENNSTDWSHSNATLIDDADTVKSGDYSLKSVFSSSGYIGYNSGATLDINIFKYKNIGFWIRSSDATAIFTLKLYDKDGNYETSTNITVDKANLWKMIRLNIDEFTGSIDWSTSNLFEIRLYVDKACTVYIDNLCFNDGWWWTLPYGSINYGNISNNQGWIGSGSKLIVDYKYDPYKVEAPENVRLLTAKIAGRELVSFIIGLRQQDTAFVVEMENMGMKGDKETLEGTRSRLQKEIDELINDLGIGVTVGI